MLQNYFKKIVERRRQAKIAAQVRAGIVPKGISQEAIWDALKATRPKNVELFGFLSARVHRKDGTVEDLGLQSVREVTAVFANRIVDCMVTSGDALEDFIYHGMGAGSTAETDTQTALVDEKGVKATGTNTHGASSAIFASVKTMTASSAFGCREHGIFDTLTGGVLLDRSLVTNIELNTDDNVEWTYNLTVNAGG